MSPPVVSALSRRVLVEPGLERRDELGFLDLEHTPRVTGVAALLSFPASWVTAPPWLGKSTVARSLFDWLRTCPEALEGVAGRVALTELGRPGVERDLPPSWWADWLRAGGTTPAVWIVDGLDEAADQNERLLAALLTPLDQLTQEQRGHLRLVIFSRLHPGLASLRERLLGWYPPYSGRLLREFALARLDRAAAEEVVGAADLPRVVETVRQNQLEAVAGYPIVLSYLRRHPAASGLSPAVVWRGVLRELLGQSQRDSGRPFQAEPDERLEAACRIAAILALTRRETLRGDSLDPEEPTIGALFTLAQGGNRLRLAAREVCRTAAFQALAAEDSYRFAQRNIQDWLTAFALEGLPPDAFRSAITTPDGRLSPRFREVARLIRATNQVPGVQDVIARAAGGVMLPSDAVEPSLAQAMQCLDELEALARSSEWGLRLSDAAGEGLGRLATEGLGAELARRLGEPARPPQVKRLLLDVAEATRALDVVQTASHLASAHDQQGQLREEALSFVCRYGGDAHLRALERPVGESEDTTEVAQALRGMLVHELFRRGLWSVSRAARHAPAEDRIVIDRRNTLLRLLEERMTLEEAREILPHFVDLLRRHADDRTRRIAPFLDRALSLIRDQPTIPPRDVPLLENLTLELLTDTHLLSHALSLAHRMRGYPDVRRRFYTFDIERQLRGEGATSIGRRSIEPEDLGWLRDRAASDWASVPSIWYEVYLLGERARERNFISERDWKSLLDEVEQHAPGILEEIREGRRRWAEREEQLEAERREQQAAEPATRTLAEFVDRALARPGVTSVHRMREIGFYCFRQHLALDGVNGAWADLPEDVRLRVETECRAGFESGQPAPIADGTGVGSQTLGEAGAFDHLVRSAATPWLTDSLILRWLPPALYGLTSGGWPDLLRACWSISQAATERVLGDTIDDQVRRFGNASNISSIPRECWSAPIQNRAEQLILDDSVSPRGRAELLESLALAAPERAEPIATQWAGRTVTTGPTDVLRVSGRNALLCRAPEAVLTTIESEFGQRGRSCVEELHALTGDREGLHAAWDRWSLPEQERLAGLLIRSLPYGTEEDDDSMWGNDHRFLRDNVVHHLIEIRSADADAALDRLSALDPNFSRLVQTRRASTRAEDLIRGTAVSSSGDPHAIPLNTARTLLDRKQFYLIRTADDLLDAALFALREIQDEVGHDLPMLFSAPVTPKARSAKKPVAPTLRTHLHEDALQAFLRRRLLEVLRRVAEGVDVEIVREDQVAYRRRFDLRVTAPKLGTRQLATVVVEIKWSSNPETRTSLADQLGKKYLLKEKLTHGIFLVGWADWWQPGSGKKKNRNRGDLEEYLCGQRDAFCQGGPSGARSALRIEPVVLDLSWREPNNGQRVPHTRASPKKAAKPGAKKPSGKTRPKARRKATKKTAAPAVRPPRRGK